MNVKKNYSDAEIKAIINENERLKKELSSMQKVLQSKRFRMAEKVANTYNALVPVGTVRRKCVYSMVAPIKMIKRKKNSRIKNNIERLIKNKKVVIVLHSIPWETPLMQRPHHLAKCLADDNDVLLIYFEPDEQLKKFRKINQNLITVNSWDVVLNLKHDSKKKYYFFFNNVSNISLNLIKTIKQRKYRLVYEYIDEFHEDISGSLINQLDVWRHLPKMKPALVLASADKLFNDAVTHFDKSVVLLSKNAVNIDDFDYHAYADTNVPIDFRAIIEEKKPIIGYYGALAPWLDYKIISEIVDKNLEYNFVFLGVNYQNALKNLDLSKKNIFYLGPKDYKDLPMYSCHFDCAIIPFKLGQIAKGTSPVKLFEYMAMGLPTVGTKDLNECKGYDYVYLAKDSKEFSKMIKIAVNAHQRNDVKEKLLNQAKDNSWSIRAKSIMERLK